MRSPQVLSLPRTVLFGIAAGCYRVGCNSWCACSRGCQAWAKKTAQRYALFLISRDPDSARHLAEALIEVADGVVPCVRCGNIAELHPDAPSLCAVCTNHKRDGSILCIVARVQDLLSIERSGAFRGCYFVLGRLLSPLEGINADDLPMNKLRARLADREQPVREVLLATPPSVDGEATALLLAQELADLDLAITRIASGVPHGGDLEFADPVTIGRAIAGRRAVES